MSGSFVQRALTFTITLGQGQFGATGYNTVKLTGLRAVVTIQKSGFPSMDQAQIRIYGVQPSIMNQINTLGMQPGMVRVFNTVTIEAGDAVNGMAVVYCGNIQDSYQSFDEAPETSLNINCLTGFVAALQPVPPISFPGSADVATLMSGLATTMGMSFENNGVVVHVQSPYLAGTALEQAHALARMANIEMYIDPVPTPGAAVSPGSATLAIWPKTGTRGGAIPLISAADGSLIGYPQYRDQGMFVRCLFNPNLKLNGKVQIKSTVGNAAPVTSGSGINTTAIAGSPNGIWYIKGPLSYNLAAQMPGGPWFCDVVCGRLNIAGTA